MHPIISPSRWNWTMHELSLAGSAVELIEATARREGFSRVRVVWMEIGALSCVEPDALRLAFEAAARGSCAEHARLELIGALDERLGGVPTMAAEGAAKGGGEADLRRETAELLRARREALQLCSRWVDHPTAWE